MYSAKIVEVKKDVYQFSQEPFIDVEVAILDLDNDNTEVARKKFAYKADTSQEDIENDLQNMLATFSLELEQAEAQKASVELNAKADETIEALKDVEVEAPA